MRRFLARPFLRLAAYLQRKADAALLDVLTTAVQEREATLAATPQDLTAAREAVILDAARAHHDARCARGEMPN